ncbi:MAG: Trk family potassium uptake protein [Clostridia bacterium]|nr:Trk family potassium uptake protein [Clostridia bacterium]
MKGKFKISPAQITVLGFLLLILLGTLLLCLPFASTGDSVHFVDALFTATSATCVTGLSTVTTATQWTLFGKIVIIFMIQIGGIGFMTFMSLTTIVKKSASLSKRKLLMQSAGSIELNGVIKLIQRVLLGTFFIEAIGAIVLSIRFWVRGLSFIKGLWYGIFHSISAFCNAGFDILGDNSLADYQSDPTILITIACLVIIGGIGFLVWGDFTAHGFRFKKYQLHSKIVVVTTAFLLVGGTLIFYFTEKNDALANFSEGDRWLNAFFESVTLRTAGFASFDQAALSDGGSFVSYVLMLIGGSPGSTAGGIKTVAFAVIFLNALSFARNNDSITIFKKRIYDTAVKHACAIIAIYLATACVATIVISIIEPFALDDIIFEVISAVATVGLTKGITASLSIASKLILCLTMFFGRMGGLTLLLAFAEKRNQIKLERPYDKVLIG